MRDCKFVAISNPKSEIMTYLNKVLWVLIPLIMTSCVFPEDDSLEEDSIDQAQAAQMTPDLIGTWTVQAVDYSSVTTYTDGDVTTTETVVGSGTDFNYSITFQDNPDQASGEGVYSLELVNEEGESQLSQGHNIISTAMWNYENDVLSFTAGGKVIEASVNDLSNQTLSLTIERQTSNTFNGVLTEETIITSYDFAKQ